MFTVDHESQIAHSHCHHIHGTSFRVFGKTENQLAHKRPFAPERANIVSTDTYCPESCITFSPHAVQLPAYQLATTVFACTNPDPLYGTQGSPAPQLALS